VSPFLQGCIVNGRKERIMEVSTSYLGGTKFEIVARGHRVICDQPVDNGGMDEGMTPPELLLASLATCAGYYAAQYLKTRGLPADELTVRVTAEKAAQPARLAAFDIDVSVPNLNEHHEAGVLRTMKACLIHNTILGSPRIDIKLNPAPPQPLDRAA
jgi:putative redox protein